MSWPVPTRRAALVAAAGLLVLLAWNDQGTTSFLELDRRLVAVNALIALVLVVDLALAPRPSAYTVIRRHPAAVTVGHEADLTWTVRREVGQRTGWANARSSRVWLADRLPPSLRADDRRVHLRVPTQGEVTAVAGLRPTRRGRFDLDEVTVRTFGPLGLMCRQQNRKLATQLRVLPRFRSAKEAELTLRRARLADVGIRSARSRGGGTEFDSLREWTPDDEYRRIDWAATARSTRPVVRTYRAEQNQNVLCLLDSGRVMAGTVADAPRLEYGMDAAMLLAEVATGLGDRMGLIAFDGTVHTTLEATARRSQRGAVTEVTFDLQPALIESDYQGLVSHVAGRYRRRHLLVLVTELDQEVMGSYVLPALPRLVRTHLVVVAAVRDPLVEQWARGEQLDADATAEEQAFLRSASAAHLAERQSLATRLRSMGALVVDETPDRFAGSLSRLYLEAKAIGRL